MVKLSGKKILLIAPKTFNYEYEIISQLKTMGAEVTYFDDRPFTSKIKKIMLRVLPSILNKEINKYFYTLISKVRGIHFDYILCIKQECFPYLALEKLLSEHPSAKSIFYTWDSFANNPNGLKNKDLFDKALTFDSEDAKIYRLIHRPLFFINVFSQMADTHIKYDLSFIGSVHCKRFQYLKKIKSSLNKNVSIFFYQYVPTKLMYYGRKFLLFPWYGLSKKSDFNFNPLNKEQVCEVFAQSRIIVDYAHHKQAGLTMRCIETLGANKKLITNNSNIRHYDFYNQNNILILDKVTENEIVNFIELPYKKISESIIKRYSILGWVSEVFEFEDL